MWRRSRCRTRAEPRCSRWSTCPGSSTSAPTLPAQCIQLISQGERPDGAQRDGVPAGGRPDRTRTLAAHQAVPHQPRGGAARRRLDARETLEHGLRRARPMVETLKGFTALWTKRGWTRSAPSTAWPMDLDDLAFCQDYFPKRAPRPHHHRDPHDRHLLVRPLPPHHLPAPSSTDVQHRGRADVQAAYERYLAIAPGAGPRREARDA